MMTTPAMLAGPQASPVSPHQRPKLSLADEHDLLLRQVASRAEEVVTALEQGGWPTVELQRLSGYLRSEMLRQVVDEEQLLLFAPGSTPALRDELAQEHVAIRLTVERIDHMTENGRDYSPAQLRQTIGDLLDLLERHLLAEAASLRAASAADEVLATTSRTQRSHEWYALTEEPVIDLALLGGAALDAVVDRLRRLRHDEQVELLCASENEAQGVWRRLTRCEPGTYGFSYLEQGPQHWRVRVTRRDRS